MKRSLASAGFALIAVVTVLFGLSTPVTAQALTMTTVSNISAQAQSVPTVKGTLPESTPLFKIKAKPKAKPIVIEDILVKDARKKNQAVAKTKVKASVPRATTRTTTVVKKKYNPKVSQGTRSGKNWATPGQCTWGAQIKWHAATGSYLGGFHGNAYTWASRAAGAGYSVGSTPRSRSVVVFAPGVANSSSVGHVAWVTGVSGNKVSIVEMNGSAGPFNWSTRTVTHQSGMKYIYAP